MPPVHFLCGSIPQPIISDPIPFHPIPTHLTPPHQISSQYIPSYPSHYTLPHPIHSDPSNILVYGFGQSATLITQRAKFTGGVISSLYRSALLRVLLRCRPVAAVEWLLYGCLYCNVYSDTKGSWLTMDAAMLSGHSGGMALSPEGNVSRLQYQTHCVPAQPALPHQMHTTRHHASLHLTTPRQGTPHSATLYYTTPHPPHCTTTSYTIPHHRT